MEAGLPIARYQFLAAFRDGDVDWTLMLEDDHGDRHALSVRYAEDLPTLKAILVNDKTVYFDPTSRTLRTGWNFPGAGAGM